MIEASEAKRIAGLAMLELDDEEADAMARDLTVILDYVEKLKEIDSEEVEGPSVPAMTPREDVIDDQSVARDYLEKIAPELEEGFIIVPPVIG